jgi:hypothetical protein
MHILRGSITLMGNENGRKSGSNKCITWPYRPNSLLEDKDFSAIITAHDHIPTHEGGGMA